MDTRITHLFDLNADTINRDIAEKIGPSGIIQFSETCKYSFKLFQREYGLAKELFNNLLSLIVRGQQIEAEEILKRDPYLLMCRGTVVDYSARWIIDVTPLQLAYGADDVEMCHMLIRFMNDIPDWQQIALNQLNEKFNENEGIDSNLYDFSKLVKSISFKDNIEEVLTDFRNNFMPADVKTGRHFNILPLVQSLEIYNQCYSGWDTEQRSLFWRQVIGYLQRLVPASYAQALCQGLYDLVDVGCSLIRSFKLDNSKKYFPLDVDEHTRLGIDYAIYSGGRPYWQGVGSQQAREAFASRFKLYVERNNENLITLRKRLEIQSLCIESSYNI